MLQALNIFLVFFLVAANGFFVASEFALVGVRRSRIATLAESGDARAKTDLGERTRLSCQIRLMDDLHIQVINQASVKGIDAGPRPVD